MFKKGFATILIVVIVLVVGGGILAWQYWQESVGQEPITENQGGTDQPVVEDETTGESDEKAYIKTITPNGGEEWTIGETYTVKWESSGVEKVNILLVDYRAPEKCALNQEPIFASIGEYVFKLENYKCDGGMTMGSGISSPIEDGNMYRIIIEDVNHTETVRSGFSDDYFTIIGKDGIPDRNEEYGFVEIKFNPDSLGLWQTRPLKIYNDEVELITERFIIDIDDIMIIDNLRSDNYVAKIEGLCPPGYNEEKFKIIQAEITRIDFWISSCI